MVSLKHLHELFELEIGETKYRSKLKGRLNTRFGDSIIFLSSSSKRAPSEKAANILVQDTLRKFIKIHEAPSPPNTEQISKELWKPQASIYTFLKVFFKPKEYNYITTVKNRWDDSFAHDLVYGIINGQTMQLKHFLLATGLHDLAGSGKVVDIVHILRHCLSYNTTCEIKTSFAEYVLEQANILRQVTERINPIALQSAL